MKPINFKMWGQALSVMPRITKEEWVELDFVSHWLVATRSAAILLTFFSVAISGLLAVEGGVFVWWKWLLLLIGLIFAHATNNLYNDYTDFSRGIDEDNYFREQYGPHPLGKGLIALAAGIALILTSGPLTLYLTIAGAVFVLFYTWPLKYIALGEIVMAITWGPLMVAGGYYVMSGVWSWNVAWMGLAYSLGVSATLFGKHIDKYAMDKAKGVHTMPVVLGEKLARYVALLMFVAEYAIIIYLVVIGFSTIAMLLVLLALPMFIRTVVPMYLKPLPSEKPPDYPAESWPLWFVGSAFVYTRRWGEFFLLGLIIDTLLKIFLLR
jgi:1,4-dihydroxy-2-naphthoate octaprenyltransferase